MNSARHLRFRSFPSEHAAAPVLVLRAGWVVLAVLAAVGLGSPGLCARDADTEKKAQALQQRGDEQFKAGQFVEAETTYRQAMELRQKLVADFPAVAAHRLELARIGNNLGELHNLTGRYKKAQPPLRQAVALLEKLATEFPDAVAYRRELVRSYQQLGQLYEASGKARQAKDMQQRAKALEKSLGEAPK
jgi:tetratricopeptide (TPR) repeat protein